MRSDAVATRLDARALRDAFGTFATGVTVMTTVANKDEPVGVTVNSFASLSLAPPLVTWSLRAAAWSRPVFEAATQFAVNVLRDDQQALAVCFSQPRARRFDGVAYTLSDRGLPLLDGALAHFECARIRQVEGGDHLLFIGEIEHLRLGEGRPLVFWRGEYMSDIAGHP